VLCSDFHGREQFHRNRTCHYATWLFPHSVQDRCFPSICQRNAGAARGIPLALIIIKEFASEKGVENMKKFALAVLLGLTALSSMISLSAPVSFAQEEPAPEPKPEKPGE
jgi:hypothetical protein